MQMVLKRRRSRKRDGHRPRELWRVHGRDHTSGRDLAVGYLVTTHEGGPVAYIHRLGLASLSLALSIRDGTDPTAPGVRDLRRGFPSTLSGYLLRPVRENGHTSGNAPFPAAMFVLQKFDDLEKLEMRRFTPAGFEELLKRAARRLAPKAATPASKSSNGNGNSTAA
ncbi:MAG: hypothetical protein QOF78_3732 [Phycisphaerales bacterium]|jgi:hypothetical protein|nr:hypothetical protein [Phycisphaerales bacterium]